MSVMADCVCVMATIMNIIKNNIKLINNAMFYTQYWIIDDIDIHKS